MPSIKTHWGAIRIRTIIVILAIAVPATIATKYVLDVTTSITKLLQQNEELRTAIGNLTKEEQIGYAKVLEQEKENGKLYTTLLFVETDRVDKSKVVLKKNTDRRGHHPFRCSGSQVQPRPGDDGQGKGPLPLEEGLRRICAAEPGFSH